MTTLTVEINKERDLPVLQALLTRLDLKFYIDNDDYQISKAEMDGIEAGLVDIEAGRVHTHEQVQQEIEQMIADFRNG